MVSAERLNPLPSWIPTPLLDTSLLPPPHSGGTAVGSPRSLGKNLTHAYPALRSAPGDRRK